MNELIKFLESNNFKIRPDPVLKLYAIKEIQTIHGFREFTLVIYKSLPTKIFTSYISEGRNILEAERFYLEENWENCLNSCLKLIGESYGRKLYLIHNKLSEEFSETYAKSS